MSDNHIEPQQVIERVESYIRRELNDFEQYENRSPFDSSGVWLLHQLARDVYALGAKDGATQEMLRASGQQSRDRRVTAGAERAAGHAAFDIRAVSLPDFLVNHMPLWDAHRCACGAHVGADDTDAGRKWAAHVVQKMTNETVLRIPESETAE